MQLYSNMPHKVLEPDIRAIQEAHDWIMSDITKPMPMLITLATKANMSLSKFRKLFAYVYGAPVYEYHLRARLERAKDLILTNEFTVSQVAYRVGFAHHQSFIKTFTKYTGLTPDKYKQTYWNSKG
jgi:AraC-like DNA-binding protein